MVGLFTTDARTRMSWFQPCALEPLYKFELLGLLTSLALYNGLTLPITFPTALYRKLLGLPVTELKHIRDGWPMLARGLSELLSWTKGAVEDVFMRSYEFVIDLPGSTATINMEQISRDDSWPEKPGDRIPTAGKSAWLEDEIGVDATSRRKTKSSIVPGAPSAPEEQTDLGYPTNEPLGPMADNSAASEAGLVTNANREQYVRDYIFWLTDKSVRPQYEAFARGFYTCLDRKALTIFTPEALKGLTEGIQEIDIEGLERTARYDDGYTADHRVIKDFWHIVRQYTPKRKRQLLEFVTASDRVPVNGIGTILFVIQRNGTNDNVSSPTGSLTYSH